MPDNQSTLPGPSVLTNHDSATLRVFPMYETNLILLIGPTMI
uniref:Uncharacterized protein n=1 Tax=Arundo donax TaxID=35708 RepID=A0A0A9FSH4_ARUDO